MAYPHVMTHISKIFFFFSFVLFVFFGSTPVYSQEVPDPDFDKPTEQSIEQPPKKFNEADFGFTTARIGTAFINDWAWYSQDENGSAQMDSANVALDNQSKVRDFRVFASGKLNTKREIIWKIALMWDGIEEAWTFRETGLIIGLPELSGKVFLGRSKEGFSMNKVQNGYSVPGIERQPALDPIPIMTDGIRYYGDLKKPNIFWSAGVFSNLIYGHSRFMPYKFTVSGRLGWLPIYKPDLNEWVHLGINYRYSEPVDDKIQIKSKPESNPAPNFVDTGNFPCTVAQSFGGEAYYFKGPLMIASEVFQFHYTAPSIGSPTFWGGNIFMTFNLTGEPYPYYKDNAVSFFVNPKKSVFNGGWGAWQAMLTATIYDTNDGLQLGGSMWKTTAIMSWFLSNNFTLKFSYGYGQLDRFNIKGNTQYFQTRFQFQLL